MYNGVQLLHGQVVTVAFSQKLEDNKSSRLYRMKSISNQLCTRNLEIIYGNKNKLWPKTYFYLSDNFFLHFRKFTSRPKISNYIWKLIK